MVAKDFTKNVATICISLQRRLRIHNHKKCTHDHAFDKASLGGTDRKKQTKKKNQRTFHLLRKAKPAGIIDVAMTSCKILRLCKHKTGIKLKEKRRDQESWERAVNDVRYLVKKVKAP